MIKKHPVFSYFLFTFIFSWLFWTIPIFTSMGIYKNESIKTIYGFGVCAPILVSIILTALISGKAGLKDMISRCSLKGIHIKWFLLSAFSIVFVCLLTILFHSIIFGNPGTMIQWYSFKNYFIMLPIMIIFAAMEEAGWRGFALARLRETYNPLASALILGFIWGVWHFPKLISEGMNDIGSFVIFEIFVILFSIFFTWIYENTNGSISLAILTHAAGNCAIYGINTEILPKISNNNASIIFITVLLIFIVLVLVLNGSNLKMRTGKQSVGI